MINLKIETLYLEVWSQQIGFPYYMDKIREICTQFNLTQVKTEDIIIKTKDVNMRGTMRVNGKKQKTAHSNYIFKLKMNKKDFALFKIKYPTNKIPCGQHNLNWSVME